MPNVSLFRRSTAAMAVAGASLLVAACGTDQMATGPELSRRNNDVTVGSTAKLLKRKAERTTTETASLTITAKRGGTLSLPGSGLTVTVPSGAIASGELTITVTAETGKGVSYDFQPHGTQFLKPLVFSQSLSGTELSSSSNPKLWGAYTAGTVDKAKGTAKADEVFSVTFSTDRKTGVTSASFNIWHFSGYVVATGREEVDPAGTLGM